MDKPAIDFDRDHDYQEAMNQADNETYTPESTAPLRFCNKQCRMGYREDRMAGVVAEPVMFNGQRIAHRDMCAQLGLCSYCSTNLED